MKLIDGSILDTHYVPKNSLSSQLHTIVWHASRVRDYDCELNTEQKRLYFERFPHVPAPEIPTKDAIRKIVEEVLMYSKDKSVGYPFCVIKPSQGALMPDRTSLEIIVEATTHYVNLLTRECPRTWQEMVRDGWLWPDTIIVKNQITANKKLLNGFPSHRSRIVSGVPIQVNYVERVAYATIAQYDKDITRADRPSRVGDDILAPRVAAELHDMTRDWKIVTSSDAKAWDWSVSSSHLRSAAMLDCERMGLPPDHPISRIIHNRCTLVEHRLLCLKGGLIIKMNKPGGQPSGRFFTSPGNSEMRAQIEIRMTNRNEFFCMGDDMVSSALPSDIARHNHHCKGPEIEATMHRLPDARVDVAEGSIKGVLFDFCSQYYTLHKGEYRRVSVDPEAHFLKFMSHHSFTQAQWLEALLQLRRLVETHPRGGDLMKRAAHALLRFGESQGWA